MLQTDRRYRVAVQYQWRLRYGALQLGGAARTSHGFSVDGG